MLRIPIRNQHIAFNNIQECRCFNLVCADDKTSKPTFQLGPKAREIHHDQYFDAPSFKPDLPLELGSSTASVILGGPRCKKRSPDVSSTTSAHLDPKGGQLIHQKNPASTMSNSAAMFV